MGWNKRVSMFSFRKNIGDLQWWLFAIPVLLVTLLAMTTVGLQALKAGLRNPVENLRME